MSNLRQTSNGKWNIVGIHHDQPGITIPATFTYNSSAVSFEIKWSEESAKTIETDWKTQLGVAIELDDIERVYTDVEADDRIYHVRLGIDEHFEIIPAPSGEPATLIVSCVPMPTGSQQTTATLTIDSNVDWTISCDVDWITVSGPLTGTGDATRTVTVAANPTTSPRTGHITVVGGGITREITITQAGAAPADTFDISAPGAMVPAVGGTVTLTITSNTSWTIASNQSWATLSKNSGTGNDTVTLTLAENTSDLRTVRISGTGGTATDYVDVKQEARGQLLPPEIHDVGINIEDTKTPVTIRFSYKGDKYYPDKIKVSVQLKKTNPLDPTPPIYSKEFTLQTGTDSFESVINTENFYVGSEFSAWITFENHSTDLEGSLIYSDSVPQESDFTTWVITRAWDDIIADDGNTLYIRIKPLQQ